MTLKKHHPSNILMPTHHHANPPFLFILIVAILTTQSIPTCSIPNPNNQNKNPMKIHPLPTERHNTTIQFNPPLALKSRKKLKRLPHIFTRVLELPFRSDTNVTVEEHPQCFKFLVENVDSNREFNIHVVEIHPGVVKIVVRPNGFGSFCWLDDLELDRWRFRLPEWTRPELARAVFSGGKLVVTVAKAEGTDGGGNWIVAAAGEFGGGGRLVLVQ